MDWSFLKKWLPRGPIQEPLTGIYKVSQEELPTLQCRRCGQDLKDQAPANHGGGPFLTCPTCQSRYYLRGY
jgi:hypothetical protein